jgi:TonB family protein
MGPEEARRYGFGMSREAHIAFVAVYLTVLLMVAGFGVLRFAATLPTWQFHWPAVPVAGVLRDHGPIADPALGAHRAVYTPIAVRLRQEGDVLIQLQVLPDGSVGDARILKSSGSSQLDAGALVSAGYWRYRPAMHNGMPVAANVKVNVRFKLAN